MQKSSAKLLPTNTVLFTSRAPIGYVAIAENQISTNQGFKSLVCNENIISPEYMYYLMKFSTPKLESLATGSMFKEVLGSIVKNFEFELPNLFGQKIINILSSLDSKIELNLDIMHNLEQLSQTLFKHWFIDFEYPNEEGGPYKSNDGEMEESELGEIPKGWTVSEVSDFVNGNIITGKTPSTKQKENYDLQGIPFITIPDMHDIVYSIKTSKYISEISVQTQVKKMIPKNSICVGCIATPGLVCITSRDSLFNQQINSFTPLIEELYYLFFSF